MYRAPLVLATAGFLACAAHGAVPDVPASLEVRFCGQQSLHPYSLSTEGGLQGLLLHQMAVINRDDEPVELTSIELDLLRDGEVVDSRKLGRFDLQTFGKLSRQIEAAAGAKESVAILCGDHLIPRETALAGPMLAPSQGQLVLNQAFVFDGKRDSLRVRAAARAKEGIVGGSATLPIAAAMSTLTYRFPVKGVWVIKSGPSFHTHHRWAPPSEFGLDLVRFGPDGRSHKNDGSRFSDYYAYGQEVLASAGGKVVRAVNDRPEFTDVLRRPGETFAAYTQRSAPHMQALLKAGIDGITGNHVMIDHGNGEYSLYAHLQPGSVRVRVADEVAAGDPIAKLGGSGNALVEPHLHFHVCNQPTPLACAGIPVEFANVEQPFVSFAPRPVQSGDIVIAK